MGTKMEGGRGKGEGEKRPAKEERNHTAHTCLATTCPFSPHTKPPLPTTQPRDSLGQNVWPLSDTFPLQRPERGKKRQASQSSVSWLGGSF